MTRGEALSHLNIQYVWLPLHKKSLEHSWFCFVFFFSWWTLHQVLGWTVFFEKRWRMQRKKCKSNLYDQNTVLLSSCQIRSWICFWWLAQIYIFPLARKKISFRVCFFKTLFPWREKHNNNSVGLNYSWWTQIISVAPKIAGEVNETTNSMGLIPFWMQLFWARSKLPYCLPKWYLS